MSNTIIYWIPRIKYGAGSAGVYPCENRGRNDWYLRFIVIPVETGIQIFYLNLLRTYILGNR